MYQQKGFDISSTSPSEEDEPEPSIKRRSVVHTTSSQIQGDSTVEEVAKASLGSSSDPTRRNSAVKSKE